MLRLPLDARHFAAKLFITSILTAVVASVASVDVVDPPAPLAEPPVVEPPSTVIASTLVESQEFDVIGVRVERWRDVVRRPGGQEVEVERVASWRAGEVAFAEIAPDVRRVCDRWPTTQCRVHIERISNFAIDLRIDSHMGEARVERVKIDLRSGQPFTILDAIRRDRRQEVLDLCLSQVKDEQLCSPVGLDGAEIGFSVQGEWVLHWDSNNRPSRQLRVPFENVQDLLDPAGPLRLAEVEVRRTSRVLRVADNGLRIVAVELAFVLDGVAVDRGRFELPEVQTVAGTPVWSRRFEHDGWGWRLCFTTTEEWSRRGLAFYGSLNMTRDEDDPLCGFVVKLLHGPFLELIQRRSNDPTSTVLRLNLDSGRPWSVRNAIRPERWTDYMKVCRRRVFKHMVDRDFGDSFEYMSRVCGSHEDVPLNIGAGGLTFDVFVQWRSRWTETVHIPVSDLRDLLEPDGPWGSMVPPPPALRRQRSLPLQ
jgi:hypothetical protein